MDRTEELEDQVRKLNTTVEEMKARMSQLETAEPDSQNGHKQSSRRGFLRLGAGAALGAIGVAAAKVIPVAAADGAAVVTGATVTGEHPTVIHGDAATAVPVFAASDPTFVAGNLTTAGGFLGALQGLGSGAAGNPIVEGVDGWAQGTKAFAVYGLTDAGTGVVGESATGIGLYARRTGRIRQDGLAGAGTPNYAPNDFEMVRDSTGALWISITGGAWRQVATTDTGMHVFGDPRRVWDGFAQPQAAGTYGPVDATVKAAGGASGVPVGAQAAFCAVQSFAPGVMSIFPDLVTDPQIANWSGVGSGVLNLLYMFVPLSPAGRFKFHAYSAGPKFFDVWGYLV